MSFGAFQLEYRGSSPVSEPGISPEGNPFSLDFCSGLRILNFNPERCDIKYGDYESDLHSGRYNHTWASWRAFERFREQEEDSLSIELRKVQTLTGGLLYKERKRYVCSRAGTGGQKDYEKKNPQWNRKVDGKFTDCKCSLVVKIYHETETVLGKYRSDHNHPIGAENLKYIRISSKTRNWIAAMVRGKVDSGHILDLLHRGLEATPDIDALRFYEPSQAQPRRNNFVVLADIRRIEKAIESETIRLDKDDGTSIFKWVDKIRAANSLLGFKSGACPVPPGSDLVTAASSIT